MALFFQRFYKKRLAIFIKCCYNNGENINGGCTYGIRN